MFKLHFVAYLASSSSPTDISQSVGFPRSHKLLMQQTHLNEATSIFPISQRNYLLTSGRGRNSGWKAV